MAVAYLGLDRAEIAHASVLTRTAQQIGGSFGTAVLAVILESAVASHHGDLTAAFNVAFWWSVGFAAPRRPALALAARAARPDRSAAAARSDQDAVERSAGPLGRQPVRHQPITPWAHAPIRPAEPVNYAIGPSTDPTARRRPA